jgi:VWFA-related protein
MDLPEVASRRKELPRVKRSAQNERTMPSSITRTILPFAILLLMAGRDLGSAGAQTAQANSAHNSPTTTLQAVTRLVYVDVVVRDSQGHIVHGLKQDQFSVKEDKQPQRVSLFEEHRTNLEQAAQKIDAPAPGKRIISNIPAAQPDSPLDMVLLDMIDTPAVQQAYARKRMIEFLRKLPPGRRVALFILNNGLHMVQGFTSDSAELAKAAEGIDIKAIGRVRTPNQMIAEHDQEGNIAFSSAVLGGGTWGGPATSLLGSAIEDGLVKEDIQNMQVRMDATTQAFKEISRAVNGIPGRKNLYWLAGQFPSDIYFTLQNVSSNTVAPSGPVVGYQHGAGPGAGNLTASGLALHPFGEHMNQVVGDSQIAVYPIDLVGIQTDVVGAKNSGIGSALGSQPDTAAGFFNERSDDRVVMNHIADETGGEAFYGNNDPAGMLRRGFEDGENYYTLVYQPQNHDWNGAYRKIAVKLSPGGYHLNYRRGYYALPTQPAGKPIVEFASAMKFDTPPSTMLTLSAVPPVQLSPGVMRLDATVDLHGVGFVADPKASNDDRKARLEVLLIAYPLGAPAKAAEINNVLAIGLTPEDYTKLLASGIPLRQTLHLVPGKYALRLGILDTVSGRIGTLTLPFTMPG